MVLDRESAARKAEASVSYPSGQCQKWTREQYDAPSVGDVDKDNDADAVDGWAYEPKEAKRFSRNVPRGLPAAFIGGSKGYGHRCISLGEGKFKSTDMDGSTYRAGFVGVTTLEDIEKQMGVVYVGYSKTISGIPIPAPEWEPRTRGARVDESLRKLRRAEKLEPEGTRRDSLLERAIAKLEKIPFYPRKLKR